MTLSPYVLLEPGYPHPGGEEERLEPEQWLQCHPEAGSSWQVSRLRVYGLKDLGFRIQDLWLGFMGLG